MKRLFLAVLFVSCLGYAEDVGYIGPASSTTTIVLEKPTGGARNCLTNLSASVSFFPGAGYTLSVLDGSLTTNTTLYTLTVSTGLVIQPFPYDNPLCATNSSSMTIVGSGTAAIVRFNYQGYIRK